MLDYHSALSGPGGPSGNENRLIAVGLSRRGVGTVVSLAPPLIRPWCGARRRSGIAQTGTLAAGLMPGDGEIKISDVMFSLDGSQMISSVSGTLREEGAGASGGVAPTRARRRLRRLRRFVRGRLKRRAKDGRRRRLNLPRGCYFHTVPLSHPFLEHGERGLPGGRGAEQSGVAVLAGPRN